MDCAQPSAEIVPERVRGIATLAKRFGAVCRSKRIPIPVIGVCEEAQSCVRIRQSHLLVGCRSRRNSALIGVTPRRATIVCDCAIACGRARACIRGRPVDGVQTVKCAALG
jgi:hypothetical protein